MTYDLIRGVVDVDAKGETGRGTIFYLEVREASCEPLRVIERHEYGLLEELSGAFKPEEVTAKYRALNKLDELSQTSRADAQREEQRAARAALAMAKSLDPQLEQHIEHMLTHETKVVAEYQAGKERALNVLVGQTLGVAKRRGLQANAQQITAVLKERLATLS